MLRLFQKLFTSPSQIPKSRSFLELAFTQVCIRFSSAITITLCINICQRHCEKTTDLKTEVVNLANKLTRRPLL